MALHLIATDVDLTLMVLDANGDYHPSTVQTFQYYLIMSDADAASFALTTEEALRAIYHEHYRVFREREPNDPNYIGIVGLQPRVVPASEHAEQPWLKGRCPQWESSNCIIVSENGFQKTAPGNFSALLGVA